MIVYKYLFVSVQLLKHEESYNVANKAVLIFVDFEMNEGHVFIQGIESHCKTAIA